MIDPTNVQPEVTEATLDTTTLADLAQVIETEATNITIRTKRAPTAMADDDATSTFDAALAALHSGVVRGIQVRYRHDGEDWCDTIMPTGDDAFRVLRVRHLHPESPCGERPSC